MNVLHPWSVWPRQVDMIEHFEVTGLKNGDLLAKLVQELSVGRNFQRSDSVVALVLRLFFLRKVHGLDDLLLLEIDYRVLGLGDLIMLRKLGDFLGDRVVQLALRVRRSRKESILLSRRIEHKVIDYLARRHVNHLDAIVVDGSDVDLLVIRRQANRHGRAGLERDTVDNFGLRLVENENGGGVSGQVQGASACQSRATSAQQH